MIKLGLAGLFWDYGRPQNGRDPVTELFVEPMSHMPDVEPCVFYYDVNVLERSKMGMQHEFLAWLEEYRPDVTLVILFRDEFLKETLQRAREYTLLGSWGCDDHWRFAQGYMQRYTYHFDFSVTTWPEAIDNYTEACQRNVIVSQWGANVHSYKPVDELYYDVTFIGQNYGDRRKIIRQLKMAGVDVCVYGRGWPTGYLPNDRMREAYAKSKISLVLTNNNGEQWGLNIQNIKARHFEIPATGRLMMTSPARHLKNFYTPDRECVVFEDPDDLVEKATYYLDHEEERERIAQAGYERTLREHTMEHRIRGILEELGFETH